jgi:hypothetical protein
MECTMNRYNMFCVVCAFMHVATLICDFDQSQGVAVELQNISDRYIYIIVCVFF